MIKQLYAAGLKKKKDQLSAFKHFINEFGTHYAAATELGTKLTIERRYSAKVTRKKTMCNNASNHYAIFQERASTDTGEISECTTLTGSKIFGFQVEMERHNCTKDTLMDEGGSEIQNMKVYCTSTF